MSKKIKISEQQLKRLVESRTKQINEDMSLDETSVGSVEIAVAKEVAPLIMSKLSEMSVNPSQIDMGIFSRALQHELTQQGSDSEENTDMMEPETIDTPMGDDNMGHDFSSDENELPLEGPLNESIKQYKTQFERFLKSPKK